jgi:hypothetical protein
MKKNEIYNLDSLETPLLSLNSYGMSILNKLQQN